MIIGILYEKVRLNWTYILNFIIQRYGVLYHHEFKFTIKI